MGVPLVDFRLVVRPYFGKVMAAVAASEMISQPGADFPGGTVGMETHGFRTHSVHIIHQSRFHSQCPCLAFSQVEVEIQSQFAGHTVTVFAHTGVYVIMQPADTCHSLNLKQTGSTVIPRKQIT